jgi:GT2 family glycosyltransferase
MTSEISIIVPCIKNGKILNNSINQYLKVKNLKEVFIVIEEIDQKTKIIDQKITYIKVKKGTYMSVKRNLAVHQAKTDYLAFYDSDSYPKNYNILELSEKIFQSDKDIYAVGGPDISSENQSIEKTITSKINQSYFISGFRNYRKKISKSKYVKELSSCNLIVKKSTYLELGGMNEKLYHAEDTDFFNKILLKGFSLYYSSDLVAYHEDRNFKLFFIQRYVRGVLTAESSINFMHKFFNKETIADGEYRYEYLLTPILSIYILFLMTFLAFFKSTFIIYIPIVGFFILTTIESLRIKENINFIYTFFLLNAVIVLQSFASLFAFFNLKFDVKKIYRNENDQ